MTKTKEREPTIWTGCYDGGWGKLLTSDSFSHPAKMSRALLERIITHGIERGWWTPGESLIGDPFGGVGNTGLLCAYHGLNCISVELEPRFVEMSKANYAMHAHKWQQLRKP